MAKKEPANWSEELELKLSIDELSKRFIEPAVKVLAEEMKVAMEEARESTLH